MAGFRGGVAFDGEDAHLLVGVDEEEGDDVVFAVAIEEVRVSEFSCEFGGLNDSALVEALGEVAVGAAFAEEGAATLFFRDGCAAGVVRTARGELVDAGAAEDGEEALAGEGVNFVVGRSWRGCGRGR